MDTPKALKTVTAFCSKKEYCRQEIRQKLEKWEIAEKDIDTILEFLQKNNFINEQRYAQFYARDKFRFNKWGKQKISLMLKQKKIAPDFISQALSELDKEAYEQTCLQLFRQKQLKFKEKKDIQNIPRLVRFGLSRGFDYDTIRRCLDLLKAENRSAFPENTRDDVRDE
ncbi:regulatory protein RecX [Odoribacter laneus]|uniref:regulatory protein RecX n=1 Tax=Odoribacter laneus TaxID=626933 RepID=UPI003AB3D83D